MMPNMNGSNSHLHRLEELACLPASDPLRGDLQRELETLPAPDREKLLAIMSEGDRLQELLQSLPVPLDPGLEEKLRNVPTTIKPGAWQRIIHARPNWRHAAALLLLLGVLTWYFWPAAERTELEPALSHTVAEFAVKNHVAAPLTVTSADLQAVQTALNAVRLPFTAQVLTPSAKMQLEGGGVCQFDRTPAAFTRWKDDRNTYTLYQFDGKKMGIPAAFLRSTDFPRDLWHDDLKYRVVLWPGAGGKCAWALVMERDTALDAFSTYY